MNAPAYSRNGQPTSRAQFYAIACDPRRSVAVEACAGAGKTWMLVSRIVRILLEDGPRGEPVQPHEILAITFTKKAAGEMRQRLQEWLEHFSRQDDETLLRELELRGMPADAARGKTAALRSLYARLVAAGRPVQIRTFHSWFAALLRTAPLSVLGALSLPAQYELLEDDAPAVALVWRRFHMRLSKMAGERADFEAVVATHGRFQTQKALAAVLAKRVEFALADGQGTVEGSVQTFQQQFPAFAGAREPADALLSGGDIGDLLRVAARALGRAAAPTFSEKGRQLEQGLAEGNAEAIIDALLTQKGEPRKFSDKLAGLEQVREAQQLVLAVRAAQAQHDAWLHQQRMARLARVLLDEFARLKRERGWVDMNDVERAALKMLSDTVLSGWVQERLDARLRHLLIDEFQDTNPLQWQALYAWLSGYTGASDPPGVFIVGDPKQSIYRFRRAEPQVFRAAQQFIREGLHGELLGCDHTRRNALGVTAVVNAVMGAAQAAGEYEDFRPHTTESTVPGAAAALPQIARPGAVSGELPGAAMNALASDTEDDTAGEPEAPAWRDSLLIPREIPDETLRTLECRQAARWIAQRIQAGTHAPRDFMVLARRRDRLADMQDALRPLGVVTQQPEKNELIDAPEVQDVVALLDALVSLTHDLSLARALKSPLFGIGDEDLVQIALARRALVDAAREARSGSAKAAAGAGPGWMDVLQTATELPSSLSSIPARLARWRGLLASLPPHDALAAIYEEADVLARFGAASPPALRETVLANLRALLSASLQIDGARYATPYALVRALKAGGVKAPALAQADAVRLLTVHGAKGLEAPVVLVLDTDSPLPRSETMGLLVDWPGEAPAPRRFAFIASESRPPACCAGAMAVEQGARRREELNALYVAMTRAQSELAIASVQPFRDNPGSWWRRMHPWCEDLPPPPAPAAALAQPQGEKFLLPVLPEVRFGDETVRAELVEASAGPSTSSGRTGVGGTRRSSADAPVPAPAEDSVLSRIGQAMHRLLERAPLFAAGPRAFSDAQVRLVAREFALSPPQAQQTVAMAQRIVDGAGGWAWDAEAIDWHGNEVALVRNGETLRLDRLVRRRDSGQWWVLDYKSHSTPGRDLTLTAQLKSYRDAVAALHAAGTVVHAAFLTGRGELVLLDG